MTSILESMLHSYVAKAGLPRVSPAGVHQYTVSLEGFSIHVGYFEERGMVLLHAGIALVPRDGRQNFYARLLQANDLFMETSGLTLGIDADETLVTLQAAWPMYALDNDSFGALFDNFVFLSAEWMQKLSTFPSDDDSAQSAESPTTADLGNMA